MNSDLKLSVIIPAFNEEKRIQETLGRIVSFLHEQPYSSEVIVVDDGSTDATVQAARDKLNDFRHKILETPKNIGKGHAVRWGMLTGEGQYLLFCDADLSTPIEEVNRFMAAHEDGYDIVIASRGLKNSNVEVHQSALRETMGKVFNLCARTLVFRGIHDSQCGFKCFKHEVAKDLFEKQKILGFGFDAEIIYLAQRKGYRIFEAPVTWRNSPNSRVSIILDPIRMFLDLVRIRWLHRFD
ncbi:MAG: glycosyltransferase family 2 protein [Candidatus Omnitrophica bacterium]|nr:glycosyltransferase family 2 protein [Candidatus Omnitrophota bacterium]